jgi:hypothetical protein
MPPAPAPRQVSVCRLDEATARSQPYCVEGTPAQRLAMVWPLTLEVWSLVPGFDPLARLDRTRVHVSVPGRSAGVPPLGPAP